MIIHANLVFYGFYLMLVEKVDLRFKTYKRNLIAFCGLAMLGFVMNSMLAQYETNFLYLRKPPMDNLPVLNLNNGYFVYILILIFLAISLLTIVHLPFMITRKRRVESLNWLKNIARNSDIFFITGYTINSFRKGT